MRDTKGTFHAKMGSIKGSSFLNSKVFEGISYVLFNFTILVPVEKK